MVEFSFEWESASGVASAALSRTWARLEIRVDGKPLSRFWSEETQSVRSGVYGSLLPLASWVARNWWVLLYQGTTHRRATHGPRILTTDHTRKWFRTHNLLFAREGMAYPDLSIMRVDDEVGYVWNSDPEKNAISGRFLDSGTRLVPRGGAESQLHRLVESVIERVSGVDDDSVVEELLSDWQAVRESSRTERELCERLGMLGVDP